MLSGGLDHGLGGEAELLVEPLEVGGGAVVLDRDDPAGVADQLRQPWAIPASTDTRALTVDGSTLAW